MKELRILLFAAILCLVSLTSCSSQELAATPAQPTQGVTPSVQDSGGNYASQSQSLHVGGTSPYGYGLKRVVYAHHFSFTFSGGTNQFDMVTDVNGFVPLNNTALGESDSTCEPGNIKLYGQFTGQTLKFKYLCDGSYIKEDLMDPSGMGTGTYQWTWLSGRNETANPPTNPGLLAQDPNQEPIPGCPEGDWGPPLDSITAPVTTWYPVGGQ